MNGKMKIYSYYCHGTKPAG